MSQKSSKKIIVVDPYFPHLIQAFIENDLSIIAVYSDFDVPDNLKKKQFLEKGGEFFNQVYKIDSDTKKHDVFEKIKQWNSDCVVNGFDTGTKLSIELSHFLKIKDANPIETAQYLRNKYLTMMRLHEKGMVIPKGFLVTRKSADSVLPRIEKEIGYPVVIKPIESADSFGVKFCNDDREADAAIAELFSTKDVYGNTINSIYAMEVLRGKEFVVCTVGRNKEHYIAGVFSFDEVVVEGNCLVRAVNLENPDDKDTQGAINFALDVFKATEYYTGQSATEIMLTEQGFRLIELNPRVAGLNGLMDDMLLHCTGTNQCKLTAMSYAKEKEFFALKHKVYKKSKAAKVIFTKNYQPKKIRKMTGVNKINEIDACKKQIIKCQIGEFWPKTSSNFESPSLVFLAADNESIIDESVKKIEAIEKEGLFE